MARVVLRWERFDKLRKAREEFRRRPCIYALADKDGKILRIGESDDLWVRYVGGAGWMVDAALHGSGKTLFVAEAPGDTKQRKAVEATLVFGCKPEYCVQNKWVAPSGQEIEIGHEGDVPTALGPATR
ncbi:MAG: hypothetical protein HY002_04450 [Candidatus Rokubacteria bacterium]|nr:hypothetical protein [Candidatus Rokubacteria bacterium]